MGGKGRRFELDLANNLDENTTSDVQVDVADYSGNSKNSFSDINVFFPKVTHSSMKSELKLNGAFLELKKTTAKRGYRDTIFSGSTQGHNGFDELSNLVERTPTWGTPYVVISWDYCKPIVLNATDLLDVLDDEDAETSVDVDVSEGDSTLESGTSRGPPFFDARLTDSGNISFRKPTTNKWMTSASAVDDWQVVAKEIGIDLVQYVTEDADE